MGCAKVAERLLRAVDARFGDTAVGRAADQRDAAMAEREQMLRPGIRAAVVVTQDPADRQVGEVAVDQHDRNFAPEADG